MKEAQGSWKLLPAKAGTCEECGRNHPPEQPHDKDSLYYQIRFQATHGRGAQWSDAVAHCPPEVKRYWKEELEKIGVWSEPIEKLTEEEKVARKIAALPTHSERGDLPPIPVTVIKPKTTFYKGRK